MENETKKDESTFLPQTKIDEETILKAKKYFFIDVLNTNYIILTESFLGVNILWDFDTNYIKKDNLKLTFIKNGKTNLNLTFKLNESEEKLIIPIYISNKQIKKMTINDLTINYEFIKKNTIKIGKTFTPTMIVFHNTANIASAKNEVQYLDNPTNTSSTSYHFAVDENEIYQAIPLSNYAYHAGNIAINQKSIGIEIAKSLIDDETIKDKAINNAINLINILKFNYNIKKSDVITHLEASGKYCPHDILDRYGLENFMNSIE